MSLSADWLCPVVFTTLMSLCTETDSVQLCLPQSCPSVHRLTVSSCICHTHVPPYRDWQCPAVFTTLMSLCTETVSSCIYHTHVPLYRDWQCPAVFTTLMSVCTETVSSCIYHTHVPLYRDWQCPFVFSTVMSLCTETDSVQLYLPCSCPYVQRLTVSNCILPHSCPSVQRLCPVYHTHGPLYRGWLCPVVFGNWAWYSVDNYLRLLWVWVSNPTAVANIRVWESFFFGWRGFQTTLESPKYDHHRNQWK